MKNGNAIELGRIRVHEKVMENITITDFYRALRRHELMEPQPGIPDSLRELGNDDSRRTGLLVSYHVSRDNLVFGIVTHPAIPETRIQLAPLSDLLGDDKPDDAGL